MMGFFEDGEYFTEGYADKLPLEFMSNLKGLRDYFCGECVTERDEVQLRMKQGAACVLKEICDVLEKGVIALPRDGGISIPT